MPPTETPATSRFWSKVARGDRAECWPWLASLLTSGYGQFHNSGGSTVAHRYAYELMIGPIPTGLDLDHLCRNRRCVNPAHLEPVTRRENLLRGDTLTAKYAQRTECSAGHDLEANNRRPDQRRGRECAICHREYMRNYRLRRKAVA